MCIFRISCSSHYACTCSNAHSFSCIFKNYIYFFNIHGRKSFFLSAELYDVLINKCTCIQGSVNFQHSWKISHIFYNAPLEEHINIKRACLYDYHIICVMVSLLASSAIDRGFICTELEGDKITVPEELHLDILHSL